MGTRGPVPLDETLGDHGAVSLQGTSSDSDGSAQLGLISIPHCSNFGSERVKITIDATSALLRSAGVKGYTYHWLRSLQTAGGADEEIRAFPLLKTWARLDHEHSALPLVPTVARLAALHAANVLGPPALDLLLGGTDVFHAGNLVRQTPGKRDSPRPSTT